MADKTEGSVGCGGLGMVIACILSWTKWHSILWLILHGLFGWFYVLYYCIKWVW